MNIVDPIGNPPTAVLGTLAVGACFTLSGEHYVVVDNGGAITYLRLENSAIAGLNPASNVIPRSAPTITFN